MSRHQPVPPLRPEGPQEHLPRWHRLLDFPASRAVSDPFLLLSRTVWGVPLQQPEQTNTPVVTATFYSFIYIFKAVIYLLESLHTVHIQRVSILFFPSYYFLNLHC